MKKIKFTNHHKGLWAETLAATMLRLKGYRILQKRYRCHLGEIDLVARKARQLCFIEVKARNTLDEAINSLARSQQTRIGRSSMVWIATHPQFSDFDISFDMILVVPKHLPRHIKNAFSCQPH